jgi:hypothetical protein
MMADDAWAAFDGPAAPPPAIPPPAAMPEPGPAEPAAAAPGSDGGPSPAAQAQPRQTEPQAAAPPVDASDPWAAFHGPENADSGGGLSPEQIAYGKDAYGHPFQSIGPVPTYDPVGQSTGTPISEGNLPGIGTQAIGSLPTDPEQRRRVIAAQLFPDMTPTEAQSRVFEGADKRLAAVGGDGKAFYVDPQSPWPSYDGPSIIRIPPGSLSPSNMVANVGKMAGPAFPSAGGIAGGMIAGPTSMVMGPAAAAAGAAIGDFGRQGLAKRFDPQPELTPYNPVQTAEEAGSAAAGQLVGATALRHFAPNPLAGSNPDLIRLQDPAVLREAERINTLAQSQGVNLTPGQASGLNSLLGHEDAIGSGAAGPGLSDDAREFYRRQGVQLNNAGQTMLGGVSSVTDKTDAAMQFQQGAEDATRLTRQNANAAARPSYDAAQRVGNVMSPDLAQLADTPAVQTAMNKARVEYENLYRTKAPDTPDFALWDLTKRQLDDAHGVARRAGENTNAMSLDSVRSDLLTHLDAAYPTYGTARATAAPGQRLASRLDSVVGTAAGDGTERARAIVAPVMEGNNPRAISEARDAFTSAGRGNEWNAGVRAYIQDAFDKASQSQAGLNPSMLRRQIWGNVDNRASIQAALDPAAYQGFDNFMQTVEAAARTYPIGSLTAPRMEAKNALLDAAGSTPGVKAVNFLGNVADPLKGIHAGSAMTDKLAGWMTKRNLANISQRLFSPDGMMYLRAMGNLTPGSQRAISATTEFMGQTAGRVLAAPANAYINQLLEPPAN